MKGRKRNRKEYAKKRGQVELLCYHEAAHAIACAAFGVPVKEIYLNFEGAGGMVYHGKKHNRLSIEARTVIAIAGLAGERFHRNEPGIVYHYTKTAPNIFKLHVPPEYNRLTTEGGTGDLDYVGEIMPSSVCIKRDGAAEWCNLYLHAAWDILHANEETFMALVSELRKARKYEEVEYLSGEFDHILKTVKPANVQPFAAVEKVAA